jgi:carbonic anhydrase
MEQLIEGYRRFRASRWESERQRFEELSRYGQRPRALVIACSDSRVDPQMIFDAHPGELFAIRNVANLVPPYAPDAAYHGTSAALEFGVRALKVADLIVMGHALCGGVQALLEGTPDGFGDFVEPWMAIAEPARRRAMAVPAAARQEVCEQEAVRLSLANLLTFPWIREAVDAGRLRLHGCYFDTRSGALLVLDRNGAFVPVPESA